MKGDRVFRLGSVKEFIEDQVRSIKEEVGEGKALCALSGGLDSSVAAVLAHRALGERLICIFVDHGLLREGEPQQVQEVFSRNFKMNLVFVDARERFLRKLAGVVDPEEKRRIVGHEFIRVFEEEARKLGEINYLIQGTVYSDVVESGVEDGSKVKSHHNVAALPPDMELRLIEPLRPLYKDEVRVVAEELGLPEEIVWRQPFPGPGLAIRILGEVTEEKLSLLRRADAIVVQEIRRAGLHKDLWQYFAVLLDLKSVGVREGSRVYGYTVAVRAVVSQDALTALWARLPYEVMDRISQRIVKEVPSVNRVVYDITSKPPATIEWE